MVMRSAYSPVVRDTMDYSTALCDRHGQLIAQGLTLAVQLGSFPTAMRILLEELRRDRAAGRRLHLQRPVRLRRPAPARHLRDQADLRRRRARGLGLRRWRTTPTSAASRPAASPCSDRDLPGRPPPPARSSSTRRASENATLFHIIEKNTRQPVQVLGDLRAQLAACAAGERGFARALRSATGPRRRGRYMDELQDLGRAADAREIAALPDGDYALRRLDRRRRRGSRADAHRGRGRASTATRSRDRLHRHVAAGAAASINCPVGLVHSPPATAPSGASPSARSRTARATCGRSSINAPRGHDRQSGASRRLRRARRDRATASSTRSWARSRRSCRTA